MIRRVFGLLTATLLLGGASCVIETTDSKRPLEPPTEHRTVAVTCTLPTYVKASPREAAPQAALTKASARPGPGLPPTPCAGDNDCTALGADSRCIVTSNGNFCHTDECFADSDCGDVAVCDCRGEGNRCLQGDCRVDDDCGSNGYCSPSYSEICGTFGGFEGYFCRTQQDTCVFDSECTEEGPGLCTWSPEAGHWACSYGLCVG